MQVLATQMLHDFFSTLGSATHWPVVDFNRASQQSGSGITSPPSQKVELPIAKTNWQPKALSLRRQDLHLQH